MKRVRSAAAALIDRSKAVPPQTRRLIIQGALIAFFAHAVWPARPVLVAIGEACFRAFAALPAVVRFDPSTLGIAAVFLVKMLLGAAPIVLWSAKRGGWRVLRIAFMAGMLAFISGLAMATCLRAGTWLLLIALSGLAVYLVQVRRWGISSALPLLFFVYVPTADHTFGRVRWSQEKLAARCNSNDGARLDGVDGTFFAPGYHAITAFDRNDILLTSVPAREFGYDQRPGFRGGSYWLRRLGDKLSLADRSSAEGVLWNGCQMPDGRVWFQRQTGLLAVLRKPGGENVDRLQLSHDSGVMDKMGVACDPPRGVVYFGDLLSGKLSEFNIASGAVRKLGIGGQIIQPLRRNDGRVIVSSATSLSIVDPDSWRVTRGATTGIAQIDLRSCPLDGSVIVADLLGRIREFHRDSPDGYSFAWGVSLPAPRKVRYSPDCKYIAVSSQDDESVFVVERATHQVIRHFHVGPALRDIEFLEPREVAAVDSCLVEQLRF